VERKGKNLSKMEF